MSRTRVAVTGMGVVTPAGNDVSSFWKGLFDGSSRGATIRRFDTTDLLVGFGCEVTDLDPRDHFSAKEAGVHDRCTWFGVSAATEAIADAGGITAEPHRVGIITGTGDGGAGTREAATMAASERGYRTVGARMVPAAMLNAVNSILSTRYDLRGPSFCISTACASTAHALGEAFRLIREGSADMVVAGGADSIITPVNLTAFARMGALSRRNDDPAHASRPFDVDRDGFVMGEGSGFLVLEAWDHAIGRGVRPHAEFLGYGRNSDAYHFTAPRPGGTGARECMRLALADAGLEPGEIGHVNAHGTSTPLNDVAEASAITEVFGAGGVPVTSSKSVIGHLIGAGGGVEAVAGIKAADAGTVPPTVNHENTDPACTSLDLVIGAPRSIERRPVLSNSFGFGGHNVSLVFGPIDDAAA